MGIVGGGGVTEPKSTVKGDLLGDGESNLNSAVR